MEGMEVVPDPGILSPKAFLDELIDERDRVTRELEHPDYDADFITYLMDYLVVVNEIIRVKETD